jgi:hypothetical protein
MILSLMFGCAPSPYITTIKPVYESPNKSGNGMEEVYYDKISNNLINCLSNNDPLLEFWQIAVIASFDENTIIDSDTMSFLDDKAIEYNNKYLLECKTILTNGIKKIGSVPKGNNFTTLQYELANDSMGDSYKENISNQCFNELSNITDAFYKPLYKRFSDNAETNYNKLLYVAKGDEINIPFCDVYVNMLKYSEHEKKKVEKLMGIYKLYNKDALEVEVKKMISKLNVRQKEQLKKLISSMESKANKKDLEKAAHEYLKTLNNEQILMWDKFLTCDKYGNILQDILTKRIEKYKNIAGWLKENKIKAEESLNRQDTIRAERARAINSALLIGLAGGLSAYGDYLSRPRPQTTIQQPSFQQPQFLYDSQGKTYYLHK